MPNQIQVELDGKAINLTVSDDQMSIVSDDGRRFVADGAGAWAVCTECAFRDVKLNHCAKIPCMESSRNDAEDVVFIELT